MTETITLPQLRAMLADLHQRMDTISSELAALRAGLAQAATPPQAGSYEALPASRLERERVKGKTYYRIMGGRYTKHGIRIWPEGLAAIGIDPDAIAWADDDSHAIAPPLVVSALIEPHQDKDGNAITGPTKIVGLA